MYHLRQTLRIILFMVCASSLTANYFLVDQFGEPICSEQYYAAGSMPIGKNVSFYLRSEFI